MEELVRPQRLGEAVGVVQGGHLLVAGLGVDAHDVAVLELLDEGEGVAHGGQEDVAAGLVGLGLEADAQVVALGLDVAGHGVDALGVALVGGEQVLGAVVLGALTAAPHHEGGGAELGGEVHVREHLAQAEAAHGAVVGGEGAVLEDGVGEGVGGDHLDHQAGLLGDLLELIDDLLTLLRGGVEGHDVVVVEGEAPCAELGELADVGAHVQGGAGGRAELVLGLPTGGPQAEGELVVAGGGGGSHSWAPSSLSGRAPLLVSYRN